MTSFWLKFDHCAYLLIGNRVCFVLWEKCLVWDWHTWPAQGYIILCYMMAYLVDHPHLKGDLGDEMLNIFLLHGVSNSYNAWLSGILPPPQCTVGLKEVIKVTHISATIIIYNIIYPWADQVSQPQTQNFSNKTWVCYRRNSNCIFYVKIFISLCDALARDGGKQAKVSSPSNM